MADFDAVVVGGGTNGLTCAAYLAKKGLHVVVLENQEWIGGGAVTREATLPGFKHDLHSGCDNFVLAQPIAKELELERYGLREIFPDPVSTTPFPDGSCLTMYREIERTCKSIEKFSMKDAKAYREMYNLFQKSKELLAAMPMASPPPLSVLIGELEKSDEGLDFLKMVMLPIETFLDELFESDAVRAFLIAWGLTHASKHPACSGGTLGFLTYVGGLQQNGIGFFIGGMNAFPESLRRCIEANGGTVLTSAEVKSIIVRDGVARGVRLSDGREFTARRCVVGTVEPRKLFLEMVGEEKLDSGFVARVRRFRFNKAAMFKVDAALAQMLHYTAGREADYSGYVHIGPTMDYLYDAFHECTRGLLPSKVFGVSDNQSVWDSTRAPDGKHVFYFLARVPNKPGKKDWESVKDDFAERCIDTVAEYAPNLKTVILKKVVASPLDLERRDSNFVGGDGSGGALELDQLGSLRPFPGWGNYRTPVKQLYMCGPFTHPGGGVSGASGHNAAQAIIEDLIP